MNTKVLVLCIVLVFSIFFHYFLKNSIINNTSENSFLEKELISEKAINKDLTSDYNNLQAYSRIMSLAKNELGMIIPANDPQKVQVVENTVRRNRKITRFLDFATPTAEAATNATIVRR